MDVRSLQPNRFFSCVVVLAVAYLIHTPRLDGQCEVHEDAKLTAFDAAPFDHLGFSVSVSGNVVVVGADEDDCEDGIDCGSAYIYRFDGTSWVHEQKLTASDAAQYDHFGVAVSVDRDTVVVGAFGDDCPAGYFCGAAYVYRFNGNTWEQKAKLTASDAPRDDLFGQRVSVDGNIVIVGADVHDCNAGSVCGAAYVYRFNGSAWVEEQRLIAPDATPYARFGISVAVRGDRAIVGAYTDKCNVGAECGSAYIYRFDGSGWVVEQKLTASDAAPSDFFGISVSLSGDLAIVGAWFDDCSAGFDCGSAYIFRFNGGNWIEEQKFVGNPRSSFGISVTTNGDTAVVGAPDESCAAGFACGAVYLYRFDGIAWQQYAKLTGSEVHSRDRFGLSVSVGGTTAIAGAVGVDCAPAFGCGSANVLELADCNDNSSADSCDIRDGHSRDADGDGIPDECEVITAALDIKPGKCPNRFNPRSQGKLPLALLGTHDFDVTQVDTDSLFLQREDGVGGSVAPMNGPPGPRIRVRDVASPFTGLACKCHEADRDGVDDLLMNFSTRELVDVLLLEDSPQGAYVTLTLTGGLSDSTFFEASDCILITGSGLMPVPDDIANRPYGQLRSNPHIPSPAALRP